MTEFWRRALYNLSFSILLSLAVWGIFGLMPGLLLLLSLLSLQLLSHLRNLAALQRWLLESESHSAPDGGGLWAEVFSRLNKMMKRQRRDREQYAAALQQMEQATSALPEGVAILDESDHIEWCNRLAELHFGLDGKRDIGQHITYLARQPEFVQYLTAANYAEPLVLRGSRHDDLVLSVKVIPYGGNKKLLISRDITHLERIETMRRDFVANVSHELRTPLTVVNGFIETLYDMPNLENNMSRRALQLMGEQTQRMESLVNDLLTLSRLENALNSLQEDRIDVPVMMRSLHQEGLALSAGNHALELQLDSEAKLVGNHDELRSAFGNLVSNAVRYTPHGGTITLRWALLPDGSASFSVQDTGIGIAAQHIPRLTERFYRVDRSRSRETGGTGLGLAIVKHIVIRHQAYLDISSEEGRGSTFSIVFPPSRVALPEASLSA